MSTTTAPYTMTGGLDLGPVELTVADLTCRAERARERRVGLVIDPDGHTVEVTWHRPREQWDLVDGKPAIVADPMELQDLLAEPGADAPFTGLPAQTTMSHVQLKVTDRELADTEPFYTETLGLDVLGRLGSRFLALGVDDRSLLVVTNRFSEPSSPYVPDNSARLISLDLTLPAPSHVQGLRQHLEEVG